MSYSGIPVVLLLLGNCGHGNVLKHPIALESSAPTNSLERVTEREEEQKQSVPYPKCELKKCTECIVNNRSYLGLPNGTYECTHRPRKELSKISGYPMRIHMIWACNVVCAKTTNISRKSNIQEVKVEGTNFGQGNLVKHTDSYETSASDLNLVGISSNEWILTGEETEKYRKEFAPPKRCELELCSECIGKNMSYLTLLDGSHVCSHTQCAKRRPGIQRVIFSDDLCQLFCDFTVKITKRKSKLENGGTNVGQNVINRPNSFATSNFVESNVLMAEMVANSGEVVTKTSYELERCRECLVNKGMYAQMDDGNYQCFHFMTFEEVVEIIGLNKWVWAAVDACDMLFPSNEKITDSSTKAQEVDSRSDMAR